MILYYFCVKTSLCLIFFLILWFFFLLFLNIPHFPELESRMILALTAACNSSPPFYMVIWLCALIAVSHGNTFNVTYVQGVIKVQKGHVDVTVTRWALFVCRRWVLWQASTLLTSLFVSKVYDVVTASFGLLSALDGRWSRDFRQVFIYGESFQIEKPCVRVCFWIPLAPSWCVKLRENRVVIFLSKAERFEGSRTQDIAFCNFLAAQLIIISLKSHSGMAIYIFIYLFAILPAVDFIFIYFFTQKTAADCLAWWMMNSGIR